MLQPIMVASADPLPQALPHCRAAYLPSEWRHTLGTMGKAEPQQAPASRMGHLPPVLGSSSSHSPIGPTLCHHYPLLVLVILLPCQGKEPPSICLAKSQSHSKTRFNHDLQETVPKIPGWECFQGIRGDKTWLKQNWPQERTCLRLLIDKWASTL